MRTMIAVLFGLSTLVLSQSVLAEGSPEAGKTKVAVCGACHGKDGNSFIAVYPRLAGLGEKYLAKQLKDIQSGERPVPEMTGMLNGLSDRDLADIAAYYDSQNPRLAGAVDDVTLLELGERVYRAGNLETGVPACTGCHSPSGNGNAPAGYPMLGGQYADYIAKQLHAFRDGAHDEDDLTARRNDDGKVMRGVAAHMTDQEIKAVANYISGLN